MNVPQLEDLAKAWNIELPDNVRDE